MGPITPTGFFTSTISTASTTSATASMVCHPVWPKYDIRNYPPLPWDVSIVLTCATLMFFLLCLRINALLTRRWLLDRLMEGPADKLAERVRIEMVKGGVGILWGVLCLANLKWQFLPLGLQFFFTYTLVDCSSCALILAIESLVVGPVDPRSMAAVVLDFVLFLDGLSSLYWVMDQIQRAERPGIESQELVRVSVPLLSSPSSPAPRSTSARSPTPRPRRRRALQFRRIPPRVSSSSSSSSAATASTAATLDIVFNVLPFRPTFPTLAGPIAPTNVPVPVDEQPESNISVLEELANLGLGFWIRESLSQQPRVFTLGHVYFFLDE
ncbi:hypothetical protein EG329_008603 [Mollisiaceae sp. DMI_Dod_QoI]|nr:hypothetical protein EG329_008603 [Helotiales sp. DMI_Dod_QoI]